MVIQAQNIAWDDLNVWVLPSHSISEWHYGLKLLLLRILKVFLHCFLAYRFVAWSFFILPPTTPPFLLISFSYCSWGLEFHVMSWGDFFSFVVFGIHLRSSIFVCCIWYSVRGELFPYLCLYFLCSLDKYYINRIV